MRAAVCQSCGAPIHWTRTEHGRPIPVEPARDGNLVYLDGADQVVKYLPLFHVGRERWRAHFATCPDADAWRKR